MAQVNYDQISKIYDDVREADINLYNLFLTEVPLDKNSVILDVGCGTGNYTGLIQKLTGGQVYGVDQSRGMLAKARAKNPDVNYVHAQATALPFSDSYFDFIYMTDVIHHIPNVEDLMRELQRVVRARGKICISTQSHQQIEKRYVTEFFPETAKVDKSRYQDITELKQVSQQVELTFDKSVAFDEGEPIELTGWFLELVEKKGYSMFHLIAEEAYQAGLERLKGELARGRLVRKSAGGTLIWLTK